MIALSQEVKDLRATERLRLENQRLRSQNKLLVRGNSMGVEFFVDQLKEFLLTEPELAYVPTKYPQPQPAALSPALFGMKHSEKATLVLSDWHLSEYVRFQDTNGINQYTSVVAANRVWHTVDSFKRIVIAHQNMYPIDEIWLPVLGDMISGDIHQELALTNDLLPVPAVALAGRLLIMAILELKTLGKPIRVDCTVGNHGRTIETMPTKQQAHMSYDWMVYILAQTYFSDDPQVKFHIHTGQFGLVDLYGHRFVVEHGYGCKREDELETRVRNIFDSPIYREATGLSGTAVDLVVIGDRHRHRVIEGVVVNGALSGAGELGMSWRLNPIPAVQQSFGTSKGQKMTWHYAIHSEHVTSTKADNAMSEVATEFMKEHGRNG